MSVKVSVFGAEKESDEFKAALKLKGIIQNSVPGSVSGEIVLFASATLYGQSVKDIDLLMLGSLSAYSVDAEFNTIKDGKTEKVRGKVDIQSFATVIEVKRHDISRISINGTDIYVRYNDRSHSVTTQSNKQRQAARDFFKASVSFSPFITNIIWFTQATPDEIKGLLTINEKKIPSNVLGSDFVFKDLVQLLIMQKTPFYNGKKYVFGSDYDGSRSGDFQKALSLFSGSKEQMGELTRKRIEMISNKAFMENALIDTEGKVSIYRGRAGTGKTVGLIQTAIHLVDEKQMRVLILTYNRALVLDIRRLFAMAELPDMFEESCVHVDSLNAYFWHLSNRILYGGKLDANEFNSNYDDILSEVKEYLSDEEAAELASEEIRDDEQLDWDYLLIDEGQDWSNDERDIVLKLFDKGRIIIADGGDQFVRRRSVCDWSVIRERNSIKLKYCLRQKENLIDFLNAYSVKADVGAPRIVGSGKLNGGKVIITTNEKVIGIHEREMSLLKKNGNAAYDMLYLVSHDLVVKAEDGSRHFSLTDEFEKAGITIWDGTNSNNRRTYSINNDAVRLLQYDSSRGLEGWTVVCMGFDSFLEKKESEYDVSGSDESLLLQSKEERLRKFLYNWAMIPLTRAIDTLIIALKDPDSGIGKTLKEIAEQHRDYVFIE